MPNVKSYVKKSRELIIRFDEDDEEPLTVTYRPSAITPKLMRVLQAAKENEHFDQLVYSQIIATVESWDLTDDDNQPIPITPEGLEDIPVPLLSYVFEKISEDNRPNAERSSTSLNGSAPRASEDRSQTGSSFSN